jgi:hypothetical protein
MSDLFIPVDLDTVSSDFTPIPEGVYKVQVEKLEAKSSKAGNPMVNVTFNVVEPTEFLGRKLFTSLVQIQQAMWKIKEFVKASGIPHSSAGFNLGDALGRQMLVKVLQETYEDNGTAKIRNVVDEFMAG